MSWDQQGIPQSQPAREWYAAYVKHQHEGKAARILERRGIEVLFPQQKTVHRWKDRNKTLFLPLFPRYLFVHCHLSDKSQILSTPGVFFLIENGGRACPIADQEIDSIRRIANGGAPVQAHAFVREGDRVRVRRGPLSGVVGILAHLRNQYRVVLTVELLQKAISVEVELSNVERVGAFERN